MQNAESHTHILFFVQLKAHSPYQLVPKPRMCHPILNWTGRQSFFQEGIHVNLCFQLVVQPRFLITKDAASHMAFDCGQAKNRAVRHVNSRGHAKAWESITPTQGPTPKCGSPW